MANEVWILAGGRARLEAMVAAARGAGPVVRVVAVGGRTLAETAAAASPDAVSWVEAAASTPPEAYAAALAAAVATVRPAVVLAGANVEGRVLLGAAAAAMGVPLLTGVTGITRTPGGSLVERTDLGGRVIESLQVAGPIAGLFGGEDAPPSGGSAAPIERMELAAVDIVIEGSSPAPGSVGGVTTAERVVSVGRGLRARDDLAMVEQLASALGAEIGCSMPIADDFGWVAKERYIGRSGQHIAPRLYLALGISGTPQHLEGVRDAKVVVAVNSDPGAHVFRRADYGIVGDLYEVVPAIRMALGK